MGAGERSPSAARVQVRILSVPLDQPIVVRHLGAMRGLLLHWHQGRTRACSGVDSCPTAIHNQKTVWRAYGPVEGWNQVSRLWTPAVLELTAGGEEYIRGRELRGEVWLWDRAEPRGKRAAVIGVHCETVAVDGLNPAFDVEPILRRFFNETAIRLGIPNPLAPKIFLNATPGSPPNLPSQVGEGAPADLSPEEIRRGTKDLRAFTDSHGGNGVRPSQNGRMN